MISPADQARHVTVRIAFMHSLTSDKRTRELFATWARPLRLAARVAALQRELDRLAAATGPGETRTELFCRLVGYEPSNISAVNGWPSLVPVPLAAILGEPPHQAPFSTGLMRAVHRAVEAYCTTMRRAESLYSGQARTFAQDTLNLSWPWLPSALLNAFFAEHRHAVLGEVDSISYGPMIVSSPVTFVSPPFEPYAGARRRLAQAGRALKDRERSYALKTKGPRGALSAYGHWFYRQRVAGHSLRKLASDYHAAAAHRRSVAACDDRPTIRHGIKIAERLLTLPIAHLLME